MVSFRGLDTNKIGRKEFGELQNMVLMENGEDKWLRENISEEVLEIIERRKRF